VTSARYTVSWFDFYISTDATELEKRELGQTW
jgi:hypothetical protein